MFRALYCCIMDLARMLVGAIKALKCTVRSSAPAQLMAVLCAVAILAVGFAHNVHHFNAPISIVAVQADTGTVDDATDTSKIVPVVIEHCFGCSMIILVNLAQPFVPHCISSDLPMRRADAERPHPPVVEIPPPIATI